MKITVEMLLTSFYAQVSSSIRNIQPTYTTDVFPTQLSKIKDLPLTGIRLFPKSTKNCITNYLYVAEVIHLANLKKLPKTIPVLCLSHSDICANDRSEHSNIIWINTEMEFADAFNHLQECYNRFVDWGKQLDFAVFKNASFQELLDIAESFLDAPILIYDPALKLLAYTQKYANLEDKIFQHAIKNGYMEWEAFKYFEEAKAFEELHASGSATGNADFYRDHTDFLRAININNELAVYCVLIYTNNYPKTYITALYQVLCDTIYNLLSKQHSTFLKDRSVTDYFLMDLLDNPDTPTDQIKERLSYNDLDYEGSYILLTIHSDILKKSSEKYFIQILRNNLINCRIFSYKQAIVILYHLPKSEQKCYKTWIRQHLQQVLESSANNNLLVFSSRPFTTIGHFAAAYAQAESIPAIYARFTLRDELRSIKKDDPTTDFLLHNSGNGFYFYEDYSLADLLFKNNANDPIYNYCAPFLLDLQQQNTKKSRQLLDILYEYLRNDRKLTIAAEKLGMHRNNVLYHIQQLSETYHVDFDDYETRLKLLLGFELLHLFPDTQ